MKQLIYSYLFSTLVLVITVSGASQPHPQGVKYKFQENTTIELLQQMISNISRVNALEFNMKVIYRIEGEQIEKRGRFKLVNEPFRIYYKQEYPRKGLEVLYVEGVNNNKILVNPNTFPWINFRLDPYGKLMTEDRHQTISEAGFHLIVNILGSILKDYSQQLNEIIRYHGKETLNNTLCHHIIIEVPDFKYINYSTQEAESVLSIVKNLHRASLNMVFGNL